MKRYRSRLKGPLPVGLKSGSISVASKGFFDVEGDDETSSDLLTKVRQNKIELVEVMEPKEVKASVEPEVISEPEEKPETVVDEESDGPEDVIEDEKDDDSLTSSSEMVESDSEETGSDDAELTGEQVSKKKKKHRGVGGKKRTIKKGISG